VVQSRAGDGPRRRVGLPAIVAAVLAVASPAVAEYRTVEVQSLRITIDSDWAPRAAPGYLPVRFDITNLGDARVIEIVGQGSRGFRLPPRGQAGSTFVRQAIRLAPGDHVRLTMPVPVFGDNENLRFEIREDDRVVERFNYTSFQGRVAGNDASTLLVVSSATRTPWSDAALRLPRSMPGRLGPGAAWDTILDPGRLPANWLGYTSLRAVAISPAEWDLLSDAQRSALLTWTACGGDLILVDGDTRAVLPDVAMEPTADPDRLGGRYFFGRVHALPSSALVDTGLARLLVAANQVREIYAALPANVAPDFGLIQSRGFLLLIPGVDGMPARMYLAILVLFSLLIGPANYWFLWRKRRLVLLMITTPAISAAFIVLLAGYAVAGDGFRVQGRAQTFTMLDQASRQAATRASASIYAAGLTPSRGLLVARDVAIFPLGLDGSGTRERLDLDLTEAQQFAGGVLQARLPGNFEQVSFRPARERLSFAPAPDGMAVTNGLDATVAALVYRTADATYQLPGTLAPGSRQVMTRLAGDARPGLPAGVAIPPKFLALFDHQPTGAYLAVLDRSPFWDPGVPKLIERGSFHLVLGWPEGRR
jgi:hypothetical protein